MTNGTQAKTHEDGEYVIKRFVFVVLIPFQIFQQDHNQPKQSPRTGQLKNADIPSLMCVICASSLTDQLNNNNSFIYPLLYKIKNNIVVLIIIKLK